MLAKSRKFSSGIIPIFILIAVGVAVLAGGVYIVRKQFIKTSETEEASLDEGKIQKQIEDPQDLPDFTPTPEPRLETGPVTVDPENPETPELGKPGFSITPPSGWREGTSEGLEFGFLAPEKDKEELDSGLVYSQPASIQVTVTAFPEGTSFANTDEMMVSVTKNTKFDIISSTKTTVNGEDACLVESRVRSPEGVWIKTISYSFYKNNYYVAVMGLSIESVYSKNRGTLMASLDTFKFVE